MNPLLFSRLNIFDVLAHRQEALKAEVNGLDSRVFDSSVEQELVHSIASKYKLENPVLEEDKAYISHREVDLDVSQDPMRMIWDRTAPFYIKGTEITFTVPFKGDSTLFQVRPSTFNLNPPRGEVSGHEIQLVQTRTDNNAAAVKAEFQRSVQEIKQYLGWLEASISDFNTKIGQQVQTFVVQRRQKLSATAEMISSIGIPVRQTEIPTVASPLPRAKALKKSLISPKKWDVFISHASEDKDDLVRPLALALRAKGISVWYDEFSLKLGDSLRASIDFGLANSRYGVVVISNHFFAKHWPVQELNGLATQEVRGRKVILPIWHKVTLEDIRSVSPMLADRMAVSSEVGVNKLVEDIVGALEQG